MYMDSLVPENEQVLSDPSECLEFCIDLLEAVLKGLDVKVLGRKDVRLSCHCSREKGLSAIATLGKKEIQEMIDKGEDVTVNCEFCGKVYTYGKEDLEEVLEKLEGKKE